MIPANPERFAAACAEYQKTVENHRQFDSRRKYGTTRIMEALAERGVLPAYHYRSAVFEDLEKIGSEALRRDHVVKAKACYNCNVYCSRYNVTQYSEGEGPEYEAQAGFTVKCGNADMEVGVAASNTVNRLGMDCITAAEIIAWLMECKHEGIITDANLIIPTGQNLANVEADMRALVPQLLDQGLSKEEMTLKLEMLVRAYDPCISCATHFLKVNLE